MRELFKAGTDADLPYIIRLPLRNRETDVTHTDLVIRWIEFWCQEHCDGLWAVREHQTYVEIGFEDIQDVVFFKLSSEFNPN